MRPSEKSLRFNLSTIKTVAFLGLFLAVAFGAFRAHAGDAPAVRANYAAFSGAFAPLWIAADKNLFSKYGLNVDLRYIAPATATQALIGKNLDIINPGGEIVEAGLNGEPVVYIAGIMNRAVMSIYAKPEIASLADLKGKVLAVTVPGATTDFAARVLLQQAHLTPGKDVKLIYLKGMVEILTGINQGNADAGIFTSPTTLKAQHAGLKELVNVTEQNIPMIHAALASTKEYVKTRRDNVRRFLQAYLEGIKISRTDPELHQTNHRQVYQDHRCGRLGKFLSDVLAGLGTIAARPGRGRANDAQFRDPSPAQDGEARNVHRQFHPCRDRQVGLCRSALQVGAKLDMRCPNGIGLDPKSAPRGRTACSEPRSKETGDLNDWND